MGLVCRECGEKDNFKDTGEQSGRCDYYCYTTYNVNGEDKNYEEMDADNYNYDNYSEDSDHHDEELTCRNCDGQDIFEIDHGLWSIWEDGVPLDEQENNIQTEFNKQTGLGIEKPEKKSLNNSPLENLRNNVLEGKPITNDKTKCPNCQTTVTSIHYLCPECGTELNNR